MRLVLEHISKRLKGREILSNLHLDVPASSLIAIVGENGVGKTTLLKIVVGDWQADTGKVKIQGKLGYCPQEPRLFPRLSVRENFTYFGAALGLTNKEINSRQNDLTNYFNYSGYLDKKVDQLSGGTKQKLNLSIALLNNPDLLILDEPYAGFDIETYTLFLDLVNELKSTGCSILMVTHMITDSESYDKVYKLSNCKLS